MIVIILSKRQYVLCSSNFISLLLHLVAIEGSTTEYGLRIDICRQEKDIGSSCEPAQTRFYFNHETNNCEQFAYGGCGGNMNRFSSMKECLESCSGNHNGIRVSNIL